MLMDVQESKLANGIRVITSAIPRVESATLGIWIGAGSRHEPKPLCGISHFIEHLLFKGTTTRSARDISQAIEGRGGYLNAFTQEESTAYYARVAYDRMAAALDVLSDMYLNPRFAPAEIAKERGVIVEEIMMYRDQPQHVVHELMTEALWKGHPLGRPIAGSPETLTGMSRNILTGYRRRCYVPGNTVLAFAGKVCHEHCVRLAEDMLGGLSGGRLPSCLRAGRGVAQESVVLRKKEIEQTHLALGIRLFGRTDKRRYALRLLNVVLGENMSSRLFQTVRERHGLAYSIQSAFQLFRETGVLVISAGLDRKRSLKALGLIVGEIERLKAQQVGRGELKRAKDYVLGQLRLGLESTTNQMMWIGDNLISHGKFIPPEEIIEAIAKVTAEEIQELSRAVLSGQRVSLAVISPDVTEKAEPAVRRLLQDL